MPGLDFMVIALPRSGSTWTANWLSSETTFCLHDPLFYHHYLNLDSALSQDCFKTYRKVGVSCTALWRWVDWVNHHPAKKVIIHRELEELNKSLVQLSLTPLTKNDEKSLHDILGLHVSYEDLFNPIAAEEIWTYLMDTTFDRERHNLLTKFNVQPAFKTIKPDVSAVQALYSEL